MESQFHRLSMSWSCSLVFLGVRLQVGDEVLISTTSYSAWETEKRHIGAVSADGRTLTLNALFDPHSHRSESATQTNNLSFTFYSFTCLWGLTSVSIKDNRQHTEGEMQTSDNLQIPNQEQSSSEICSF